MPIYVAADRPQSAAITGRYGDGWVCQAAAATNPTVRGSFERAARAAGKDPDAMPIFAESFVVVGDQPTLEKAARLWRFTAAGSGSANPVEIQHAAEHGASLVHVTAGWATGIDPQPHLRATQRLLDVGATPFIHAAQPHPGAAIDLYRTEVLPRLRT